MEWDRREVIKAGIGAFAAGSANLLHAAGYPERPVTIMTFTTPGSSLDMIVRLIGDKLRVLWNQTVIVESKPGASGTLVANLLAKSAADGYMFGVQGSAIVTSLFAPVRPAYRLEDFSPVSLPSLIPAGIGVRTSLGVKTMQDFIALAKAQPGKLSYGSPGNGSNAHIVGELLKNAAGIDLVHVPYKGEAPALQDCMGGQIDAVVQSVGGVARFPGKITPLAITNGYRLPAYPDLPTLGEAGLQEANLPGWAAIFAPATTPKAVIDRVSADIARIVTMPDVVAKLAEVGHVPAGFNPSRLAEIMQTQARVAKMLSERGQVKFG